MIDRALLLAFVCLMPVIAGATNDSAANSEIIVVESDIAAINHSVASALSPHGYVAGTSPIRSAGVYFDTPELLLLKSNGFIRYQAVEYLSKRKKKTKFHEFVQHSVDGSAVKNHAVKHYNSVKTIEGKHPLLGLVKRKERPDLVSGLNAAGINYPLRLKQIARVSRVSHVYHTGPAASATATVVVSEVMAAAFERVVRFNTIRVLSGRLDATSLVVVDAGDPDASTDTTRQVLLDALGNQATTLMTDEYSATFGQLQSDLALFTWLLRYPFLVNLLYSLLFGLLGALLIGFIFWRRSRVAR